MSYKMLALFLLVPFVASSVNAQITSVSYKGSNIIHRNPLDPRKSANGKEEQVVNEHEEGGTHSQEASTGAEDNDNSSN